MMDMFDNDHLIHNINKMRHTAFKIDINFEKYNQAFLFHNENREKR